MIHHRQRLALGLEARHDLFRVHAQPDDLERHSPPLRMGLPSDGVDPIKRQPQRNLKRDLARARRQQSFSLDPLDDLAGIAKLGEEPLHHRLELGPERTAAHVALARDP